MIHYAPGAALAAEDNADADFARLRPPEAFGPGRPSNAMREAGLAPTPSPEPELQRLSHVHDAIMNWMLHNPQCSMRQCADAFGYTQSWLSTMVHSGLFQARLKEKQDAIFGHVAISINEKMAAVADVGIEKLGTMVEKSEDAKFILQTTTLMLDKLGFGAATRVAGAGQVNNAPVQNNFYMASPEDLAQARQRMNAPQPAASLTLENGESAE